MGYKEIRFLFPVYALMNMMIACSAYEMLAGVPYNYDYKKWIKLFLIASSIYIAVNLIKEGFGVKTMFGFITNMEP